MAMNGTNVSSEGCNMTKALPALPILAVRPQRCTKALKYNHKTPPITSTQIHKFISCLNSSNVNFSVQFVYITFDKAPKINVSQALFSTFFRPV